MPRPPKKALTAKSSTAPHSIKKSLSNYKKNPDPSPPPSPHPQTQQEQCPPEPTEAEAFYRTVFNHSQMGIVRVSLQGRFLQTNSAFQRMLGYSEHELLEKTIREVTHPEDMDTLLMVRELVEGHRPSFHVEKRYLHKNSGVVWAIVDVNLVRDAQETPRYLVATLQDITPRKLAQAQHQTSAAQFQSLFNHMAEGVALHAIVYSDQGVPINYRLLDINPQYERILNLRRDDVVNRLANEVYQVPEPPYLLEFTSVCAEKKVFAFETYFPPMDRHFSISVAYLQPGHFATIFTDITERRKSELALQRSEERYRLIFENTPLGIIHFDLQGTITDCNVRLLEILGSTRERLIGFNVFGQVTNPGMQQAFRDALEKGIGNFAGMYQSVTGSREVTMRALIRRIQSPEGKTLGGTALFEDVSEQHRIESALRESEDRFRSIFEQSPLAIQIFDAEGYLVTANPISEQLFGKPQPHPKIRTSFLNDPFLPPTVREALLSGTSAHFELELPLAEHGRLFATDQQRTDTLWLDVTVVPLREHTSEILRGYLMLSNNITERRQAENEKNTLADQLRQAQKMEMIGLLAGGVAHDFNNLLSPILGYADLLLLKYRPGHPDFESLAAIKTTAERASQLTRQLLALSRKQVLNMQPLNLNKVLLDFNKMLRTFLGENITLQTHADRHLHLVMADPVQVHQVLMNLAINAREAMPQGGLLIFETANVTLDEAYTRTHAGVIPGDYVMLSVTDNGQGISPETMQHIFEPFFTTKESAKGTGLGLSIVYGIIRQHNGHIWTYSEPGQGTTFKLFFQQAEKGCPETPATNKTSKPRLHGRETLLLVEDEPLVRKLAEDILTAHGYKVLVAQDGFEALQLVRENKPRIDLLVSDVIMPGLNGRELHQRLLPLYPGLRVLFISGYTQNVLTQQGGLNADVELVQKPFTIQALLERVRLVIDRPSVP